MHVTIFPVLLPWALLASNKISSAYRPINYNIWIGSWFTQSIEVINIYSKRKRWQNRYLSHAKLNLELSGLRISPFNTSTTAWEQIFNYLQYLDWYIPLRKHDIKSKTIDFIKGFGEINCAKICSIAHRRQTINDSTCSINCMWAANPFLKNPNWLSLDSINDCSCLSKQCSKTFDKTGLMAMDFVKLDYNI